MQQIREKFHKAFESIFGGSTARKLAHALELCEVAEDEIARAYPRAPDNKPTDPPGLFMGCAPTDIFEGVSKRVYVHHVRELIARSQRTLPIPNYKRATDAEVLLHTLEASKIAPLTYRGMLVAHELFTRVFPKESESWEGGRPNEQWPGQLEEAIEEARRIVTRAKER